MTEYSESAFMADLLLGDGSSARIRQHNIQTNPDQSAARKRETAAKLERIVDRLRAQTIHIISAYRYWQRTYALTDDPLEERFLMYEGALCRQNLMQHRMLYRRAMAELYALKAAEKTKGRARQKRA